MKKNSKLIYLLLPILVFTMTGCDLLGGNDDPGVTPSKVTLNYWRPWDGRDDFAQIISKFENSHRDIRINYIKKGYNGFERELIEAYATDRGPDIYSIHNTWMKEYQTKGFIRPLPPSTKIKEYYMKGAIKKEMHERIVTKKSLTLNELRNDFVGVVYDDVVIDNQIYGLPLFVDNLALFYNKDLLNNIDLVYPPEFWNNGFQPIVKKLTKQNSKGEIIQSGVAMGGVDNIERSSDIISLLMLQNGTEMMGENGDVLMDKMPVRLTNADRKVLPAEAALRFYTDFSNIAKEVYCWNDNLDNSLDMFSRGNLAMMFGYSYMIPQVKKKNEKLNFDVAPMLQIESNTKINFANYWVEVVSKKIHQKKIDAAWIFIQYITKAEQAQYYLKNTKRPTALKSLIDRQLDDQDISVFAEQVMTARSWYHGKDSELAESAIDDMVKDIGKSELNMTAIVKMGTSKIQQSTK